MKNVLQGCGWQIAAAMAMACGALGAQGDDRSLARLDSQELAAQISAENVRETVLPRQLSAEVSASVRQRLAAMVNSGLSKNGFDELVATLSKGNRDRIAERPFAGYDALNAAIVKLRSEFQSAYRQDFAFTQTMLRDVRMYEDGDGDHATLQLTAGKGWSGPVVTLSVVNESVMPNGWRVEFKNPTADALGESLTRQLNTLSRKKAAWPKDPVDGHRMVAACMFEALCEGKANRIAAEK